MFVSLLEVLKKFVVWDVLHFLYLLLDTYNLFMSYFCPVIYYFLQFVLLFYCLSLVLNVVSRLLLRKSWSRILTGVSLLAAWDFRIIVFFTQTNINVLIFLLFLLFEVTLKIIIAFNIEFYCLWNLTLCILGPYLTIKPHNLNIDSLVFVFIELRNKPDDR